MGACKTGNGGKRKVGGENPKSVWWNNEIKAAVRRKDAAWKGVLAASYEETNERCMVKRRIIQSKKESK